MDLRTRHSAINDFPEPATPADLEPSVFAMDQTPAAPIAPAVEAIAMHRLAFGPRPGDVAALRKQGFEAWVKQQVRPPLDDGEVVQAKLDNAALHIEYEDNINGKQVKVNEDRKLTSLKKTRAELWALMKDDTPWAERARPVEECRSATIIRAVHSPWQLREVLADFWHNHFSVNAYSDDDRVRVLWPIYDREVIRANAFGNFRTMLESVATSMPMLVYLNNAVSRASPANENYARELFELHTLGRPAYLSNQCRKWSDVPGAREGKSAGYIDEDVYEAARAFTGWTIADGKWTGRGDEHLPNTGDFHYFEGWHDSYQKRVLGKEIESRQPAMHDGREVLDLVAYHPATANYVCTKLVRRLVSDSPPKSLVERAAKLWMETQKQPDQIARVVEMIALSPEFRATWGQKVKRPLELIAAFMRATGAEVNPQPDLLWMMYTYGQPLFQWPLPTGFPDESAHWLGTVSWLQRWNMPVFLVADWQKSCRVKMPRHLPPEPKTYRELARHCVIQFLGYAIADQTINVLGQFLAGANTPDSAIDPADNAFIERFNRFELLIAMTPDFHYR